MDRAEPETWLRLCRLTGVWSTQQFAQSSSLFRKHIMESDVGKAANETLLMSVTGKRSYVALVNFSFSWQSKLYSFSWQGKL